MKASGVLASVTSREEGPQAAHNNRATSDFTGGVYNQESSVDVPFVKASGAPRSRLLAGAPPRAVLDQFPGSGIRFGEDIKPYMQRGRRRLPVGLTVDVMCYRRAGVTVRQSFTQRLCPDPCDA